MSNSSYRQILRSTSIIGGASLINIVVGLVRMKAAALLVGPAGVGLIGLLTSLTGTAAAVAGLGFGNVGTRQVAAAAASDDAAALATARRALVLGTLGLAVVGTMLFWNLRTLLAEYVIGAPQLASEVGYLALAVGLTVAAASQTALLNGMRRIGDLARVSVLSALLSSALAIGALLLWGSGGLVGFVLAAPLAAFIVGHVYVARLPKAVAVRASLAQLGQQWRTLAQLGTAFMLAGLASTLSQLMVRSLVQADLGSAALGYFQASSAISMTYIGFVLGAMGTDFYPRLTAAIADPQAVNQMVNEQTEIALALAGPVLLAMLGLAPWVIALLYSESFAPAAEILRWQVLGDVLKVVSWPLGFILLAAGDGRNFMLAEAVTGAVFVLATWLLLPLVGLLSTGLAFCCMYVVLLPLVYCLARRRTGFRWHRTVVLQGSLLLAAAGAVMVAATLSPSVGGVLGLSLSAAFGLYGCSRLLRKAGLPAPVAKLARLGGSIVARLTGTRR